MKKIVVIIPAYNEDKVIGMLFERLKKIPDTIPGSKFEFLFVNDGSTDRTLDKIIEISKADKRVSYVNLSRNYGKETAMLAGLDYADGDAVVLIDADLQDPPELIPSMVAEWKKGYDDIYAKRRTRSGETWSKKLTSSLFYSLLQKSTHIPIQKDTGDFRLLDKKCVDAIVQLRESQRYMKGIFSWVGYRKKEILFDRDPRAAGDTKWNYLKLIELAIEGITSFTVAPLRISTIVGFFISLIAFFYIAVLVVKAHIFGIEVAGYTSIMGAVLFMGGVQLLSIGIIGEYVGRIFKETKKRPLYFIQEVHLSSLENK